MTTKALPGLCAGLGAGLVLGTTKLWLEDAAASGHHTGAAIALGLGVILGLGAAVFGYFLGRAIRASLDAGRRGQAALLAATGLSVGLVWVVKNVKAHRLERHLTQVRSAALTDAQAAAFEGGTLDERRSLAYNRHCPPEVLARLAKSPDEAVRASAAGNPATPAQALEELAKDPSEVVRYYLSYNPSRPKEASK